MIYANSVEQRMAANKASRDRAASLGARLRREKARADRTTLRVRPLLDSGAAADLADQKKPVGLAPKRKSSGTPP
jgi:hypothetical protein